jgi:hypothetical protein
VVDRVDVDASSAVSSFLVSVGVDEVVGRDVVVLREVVVAEAGSVREALRFAAGVGVGVGAAVDFAAPPEELRRLGVGAAERDRVRDESAAAFRVDSTEGVGSGMVDGGGVVAGGVTAGVAGASAADLEGGGTPTATATPPDTASTIRVPRAAGATAAATRRRRWTGRWGAGRVRPTVSTGRIRSASTTTSRRSSVLPAISVAGFPPHRASAGISSPFIRKESGASTERSPIRTL